MIRLYREFVIQLLAVLKGLHVFMGSDTKLFDDIVGSFNKLGEDGPHTLDDIIKLLEAQVQGNNERRDVDLIDLMVETLKLPYVGNLLTHQVIMKLKHVLLIPNELNALVTELKRQEMRCYLCSSPFQESQLTVVSRYNGNVAVYCTACITPTCLAAADKKVVKVSKALRTALKKNAGSEDILQDAPVIVAPLEAAQQGYYNYVVNGPGNSPVIRPQVQGVWAGEIAAGPPNPPAGALLEPDAYINAHRGRNNEPR